MCLSTVRHRFNSDKGLSRAAWGYHETDRDTYVYVLDGSGRVPPYRSAASSLVKAISL